MNNVKEWCWKGGAAPTRHHDWSEFCSAPQEGDQQSQHAKTLAELQARKNAIDITGAICRTATDLLHRSHSQPGTALYLTFPECIHHPEDFTEAIFAFSFTKPFSNALADLIQADLNEVA